MNSQLQSQDAMNNLGILYVQGQGAPQSYERAAELFKQSAALGEPVSQRDQAQFQCNFYKLDFTNGRTHFHCTQSYLTKPTDIV